MGGSESTVEQIKNKVPSEDKLNEWSKNSNIDLFYKACALAEPELVKIFIDYKLRLEYEILHAGDGDFDLFIGNTFTYSYNGNSKSFEGKDIYYTYHKNDDDNDIKAEDVAEDLRNENIYDTFENWKKFRTTALLESGQYADLLIDDYWSITVTDDSNLEVDTDTITWFDLFTGKFNTDKSKMTNNFGNNYNLYSKNSTLSSIAENQAAATFVDALKETINNRENNLETNKTAYDNIYVNLVFHSYYELITAAQTYYRDTKHTIDMCEKGLLGLLDYYLELCQGNHMVYTTMPEDNMSTFEKKLYDEELDGSLGNLQKNKDFDPLTNEYILDVIKNKFSNKEKEVLRTTIYTARLNNYISLVNTYLQICALVMDEQTFDSYFNSTNGWVKTLSDKDLANKYTEVLSDDYLINEETSIDSKYNYGIISRRVILPEMMYEVYKGSKLVKFNVNRRDLQKKEYYLIQIIRWLLKENTDTIKLTNDWSISLSDDLNITRKEFVERIYIDNYSGALQAITDLGSPFIQSAVYSEILGARQKYIDDYNTFVQVYNFARNEDVIAEFKTYPSKSEQPNTDKITKLNTLINTQTSSLAVNASLFNIDYYAYRTVMLLNGMNGWNVFKGVLNKEAYLISYVIYWYTKKYEKWISKYCQYKNFVTYFDKYMSLYYGKDKADDKCLGVFEYEKSTYNNFTFKEGKMYDFLLSPSVRGAIDENWKGNVGLTYNKWMLLGRCMSVYNGVYGRFSTALSYVVQLFGKYLHLVFTELTPTSADDKANVKKLPFVQETADSIRTISRSLNNYLYHTTADSVSEYTPFHSVFDTEAAMVSCLEFISRAIKNVNITVDGANIRFAEGGTYKGFDKVEFYNDGEKDAKAYVGGANIVIQRMYYMNNQGLSGMTDTLKNALNEFEAAKKELDECSKTCESQTTKYTTAYNNLKTILANGADRINIENYERFGPTGDKVYTDARSLINKLIEYIARTYYVLYKFCSAKYVVCNDVASQQLPMTECYEKLDEALQTSDFEEIKTKYENIKANVNKNNKDYIYESTEGEVNLLGLIAITLCVFNTSLSNVFNNAVRIYYERYMAEQYDKADLGYKLISTELSDLIGKVSAIQFNCIENDNKKTREENKKK